MTNYIKDLTNMWMVVIILLSATSVVLAQYQQYQGYDYQQQIQERNIINKYPGYFRTDEEQRKYDVQYQAGIAEQNVTVINVTEQSPAQDYCTFFCEGGYYGRKRRQVGVQRPLMEYISMYKMEHKLHKRATVNGEKGPPVFHGCCVSRHFFTSPDFAENGFGNTVELVQFDNRRQYFPTWECKQAANCDGCGCGQEKTLMTAVVKNTESEDSQDETVLNFIKLPGCCKCFNNLNNFNRK